jgi:autotransporter-associated beta strand protein
MNFLRRNLKSVVSLAMLLGAAGTIHQARADAEADLVVGYGAAEAARFGSESALQAATLAQIATANNVAYNSGTPHRQRVVGFIRSATDCDYLTSTGGMVGWLANYDGHVTDVLAYADYLGADLVTYIFKNGDSVAGVAQQPGRTSAYNDQMWWTYFAHESGGHNFGGNHGDAYVNPTTVMANNYCGGGAQGYYTNPNIWLNGVKLLSTGNCTGGTIYGGDTAYLISTTAQGRADAYERRVWGSWRGAIKYRWQFNKPAGAAPAGTVISDEVAGAQAIVRGVGATYTGAGLRLPGGTTGNTAANSIAAYIDLPNGMFSAMPSFTIEIWATPIAGSNWMRVIDIGRTVEAGDGLGAAGEYTGTPGSPAPGGTSASDSIELSAANNSTSLGNQRFIAGVDGSLQIADSTLGTNAGEMHHYAITFADATNGAVVKWFRDGVLINTLTTNIHSSQIEDVNNWLGRSLWSGDTQANIDYHDVRIQNVAIADGEVAGNYRIGPNDKVVTQWANDAYGSSGWVSGAWEFGQSVPDASHDYETGTMTLRTPANSSNNTFPGRSLSITGGNLLLKATAATTTTVNDLRLFGGKIIQAGNNGLTQTLAGQIKLSTWDTSHIRGGNGPLVISANISTVAGSGNGILLYSENAVTLTGNNTGYTGATWVGDGRFSTLRISSETNLGGNPPWFGGDWLTLNRGILETTQTMTIDDPNRGIRIGPGGGFLNSYVGTTLTIATPISSPAAGNTLQTAPMDSNPIVGILFVGGGGTVELTNPNNSHNGEMQITYGELKLSGNGRLNNGDHWMPFLINGLFTDNSAMDQTIRGVVSGGGAIVKGGAGTLNVNGSNTFTGSVTVTGGTLYANPGNAATNRAFSYVSGITVNNGGTLKSGPNGLFGWDGTQVKPITVNTGGNLTTDATGNDVNVGTVTLNGGTLAGGPSTAWGSWNFKRVNGGKLVATDNSAVTATNVGLGNNNSIDVAAGKTLTFSGTITDLTSEGVCALVKSGGTGTLILTNTNTYTGATNINAGTLKLNGSIAAASAVAVASGATLSGTGTVNGALTFSAGSIHAPGDVIGTQTVGGALSYANTTRVKWNLLTNSDATGAASRVAAGAVTVASGAAIDLVLNATGSTTNYFDTFWTQPRSWTVISSSGMSGTFTLGTVSADSGARAASGYGSFSLSQSAAGATLTWTPKPFAAWRGANFGAKAGVAPTSDFLSNPDGDALANAWEYFYNTNPNAPTATPLVAQNVANRATLTFPRNTAGTDVLARIQGADNVSGPWTDLAQSSAGAAFTPLVGGVTVNEAGTGATRAVTFTDLYLSNDPAHPQRFFRLWIQQQ